MAPAVPEELRTDLAMMARVVRAQLDAAVTAFFERDVGLAQRVSARDDQIDNLLGLIEERCFHPTEGEGEPTRARARQLRGVFRVALNLEKLGDYAVNIAEQAVHLARLPAQSPPFDLRGPARSALAALDEAVRAFIDASADHAKHACRCETELDQQYRDALTETFRRLGSPGEDPAFVITNLFVSKFLERIGDSILNIGETTLFLLTGERLKLHQYLHLEEMVDAFPPAGDGPVDFRQIWGGISGARIGRLSVGSGPPVIWKEGAEGKIEDEVRQTAEWNRMLPGLVPDLRRRLQRDGRESMLREFVDGALLRDVYLTRQWDEKVRVTRRLLETVRDIWVATARNEPPRVDYSRQIAARLGEIHAIHPNLARLRSGTTRVFGISHSSMAEMLGRLGGREGDLAPPISVRIHGDFNTNNVIYDARRDRVHFIDVHRSGSGDYLQDISVFLVSSIRSPIQDPRLAAEMLRLNRLVTDFAAEFAHRIGDPFFARRLPLAQARSLITSARVVVDPELARALYLRGVGLLERCAWAAA